MSKFIYIIDNGHGGVIDGIYQTAPNYDPNNSNTWKKMYVHNDEPIFEGEFNRKVSSWLESLLIEAGIEYVMLVREDEDISLGERVRRVNKICNGAADKYILISIHSNAAPKSIAGKANGDEIWTSVGETKSDNFASKFSEGYRKALIDRRFRKDTSDGDIDKESNFYILKHTHCAAMLTENGFFDNPTEAKLLNSEHGIELFAKAHLEGIKTIENYTTIH